MKIFDKKMIKHVIVWLGIVLFTDLFWKGLELVFYKEVQPRIVDNYIATILCVSLYLNYLFLAYKEEKDT